MRAHIDDKTAAELRSVADSLADAARLATLRHFRRDDLMADNKESLRFDPVTEGDRAAEDAMRALLAELRPQDAILGEERGHKAGSSGLTWVLDPIDGTRSFMSGSPVWGVLIGLRDDEGPILGIIDQPYIGERFTGGLGQSLLQGPHGQRILRTRAARPLSEAVIFSTYPEVGTPVEGAAFQALARECRLTRYGLDCYAYGLLAMGQIDLVVEAGLQPYDIMSPIAVIEAAGGIVTDWQGRPAHEGGRVIAAANADIHAEALERLARAPENAAR